MKPIRSMMFVPGNKPSMIEKAAKAKADALILDLEDSVPPAERLKARELIVSRLSWLAEQRQRIYVRINRSPYLYDFDDMLAVVGPLRDGGSPERASARAEGHRPGAPWAPHL